MDKNSMKLILAAEGKISATKAIDEVMNDYSHQIHQAIMPVSNVTAPFVVAVLKNYAKEIEGFYPGVKEKAEEIAKIPTRKIQQETTETITLETVGGWNL